MMESVVRAVTEATEQVLGAVFHPENDPMGRYCQAVRILAELERLGFRVEPKAK